MSYVVPTNWYWSVLDASPGSQVYASISMSYVVLADAGYVAFLAAGNTATIVSTYAGLIAVLNGGSIICDAAGHVTSATISHASPGVVGLAAHNLSVAQVVNFTTTGGLPAPLAVGTNYYVSVQNYAIDSFCLSTSAANALAGISIDTTSDGSGTHTLSSNAAILATTTAIDVAAVSLPSGAFEIIIRGGLTPAATTIVSNPTYFSISQTSATPETSKTSLFMFVPLPQTGQTGGNLNVVIPTARILLPAPANLYLVLYPTFATSTATGYGMMTARHGV